MYRTVHIEQQVVVCILLLQVQSVESASLSKQWSCKIPPKVLWLAGTGIIEEDPSSTGTGCLMLS